MTVSHHGGRSRAEVRPAFTLVGFAAVLALVFAAAFGVGSALGGPVVTPARPSPDHSSPDHTSPGHSSPDPAPTQIHPGDHPGHSTATQR